jgi:hypothetical protein
VYFRKTEFLRAFTKLREAAVSFVMSARLSVRKEELGSYQTDFHEILYFGIFQNLSRKF